MGSFLKFGAPLGLWQVPTKDWEFSPLIITPEPASARIGGVDPVVKIGVSDEWIEQQIQGRREARERKNFAEADKIRQELASKGIILEDRPDGTTRWKR